MAFQLLTFRQSGALVKRQPMHLFTMVEKRKSVLNLSPHSTPQSRLQLGITINIARKTAIDISTRGKREKASLGPVTGRFANVLFVNVLHCRSAKKRNERCVYWTCVVYCAWKLGFIHSAIIQKKAIRMYIPGPLKH